MKKEVEIQAEILYYLRRLHIFAWRNNNNGIPGRKFVGLRGVSDIIGIYKGRFLAIEVKSKKGILSDEQNYFLDMVRKNNGIVIIARSLNDVVEVIKYETNI